MDQIEEPVVDNREKRAQDFYEIAGILVSAVLVVFVIFTFFFRPVRVDGTSMLPTLQNGNWLLVSDWGFHADYGDVVIVTPTQTTSKTLHENIVKRVIARGGDTIDVDYETDTVTVNGNILSEPYLFEQDLVEIARNDLFSMPMTVPEGYVFVMGDNRNNSLDSRYAAVGMVDERYLLGQAKGCVFPLGQWHIEQVPAGQQAGDGI